MQDRGESVSSCVFCPTILTLISEAHFVKASAVYCAIHFNGVACAQGRRTFAYVNAPLPRASCRAAAGGADHNRSRAGNRVLLYCRPALHSPPLLHSLSASSQELLPPCRGARRSFGFLQSQPEEPMVYGVIPLAKSKLAGRHTYFCVQESSGGGGGNCPRVGPASAVLNLLDETTDVVLYEPQADLARRIWWRFTMWESLARISFSASLLT